MVPCFNEARRLDCAAFERSLEAQPDLDLLLVDDGSTDDTLRLLLGLEAAHPGRISVLAVTPNAGKAEAVRLGMLQALQEGAAHAGFWDADLATPLDAVPAFIDVLRSKPEVCMVFGSRVKLMGRQIERNSVRHYLGRVFATAVSMLLRLPIYDTQCGAKLFRNQPPIRALFEEPFVSSWVFDVELIARWIAASRGGDLTSADRAIFELPLVEWRDVGGSKVRPRDYLKAIKDFWRIRQRYFAGR